MGGKTQVFVPLWVFKVNVITLENGVNVKDSYHLWFYRELTFSKCTFQSLSVSVSPPSSPAVPICSSSVTALSNKSAQECMLSFADAKGQ